MRPATRVVPKALLTVVDKPAIQYAVEEASRVGAKEALLIVDLEVGHLVHQHFVAEGRLPGLENMRVRTVVQEEPLGLGHAVMEAREMIDGRPFFCILADDIVRPGHDMLPKLARASDDGEVSVVCVRPLGDDVVPTKGIIIPASDVNDGVLEVGGAVEKPSLKDAPSNLGVAGRYLFSPAIFQHLESVKPGHGGEIQLTDAIHRLGLAGLLRAVVASADLLDIGTPLGLLEASAYLGYDRFGEEYLERISGLTEQNLAD